MKGLLFCLAAVGWCLSLSINIFSIAAIDLNWTPFIWILSIGVFLVWIPTVVYMRLNKASFEGLVLEQPVWVKVIVFGSIFYVIINTILYINIQQNSPLHGGGRYISNDDYREYADIITKEEFHKFRTNIIRGFSGWWILFYSVVMGRLYKP